MMRYEKHPVAGESTEAPLSPFKKKVISFFQKVKEFGSLLNL